MPEGDNPQGGNEQLQALLDKHKGDAMALAMALFGDNFKLREKNRTLKEQVPADGSVVLKKEDADRLAAFDALGLKPEDAKAKIEAAGTVEAENKSLKRTAERNRLVELGYQSTALADFDDLEGSAIESYIVKDEKKDGKDVKVPYVKVDGKERAFDEYAKEKRPALASVLRAEQSGGRQWPSQDPGGKAPAKDVYQKARDAVKASQAAAERDVHPMFKQQAAN